MQTYVQLQQSISEWLKREDLGSQIQSFISLAEADLRRRLRTQRMLTTATLTVSAARATLPTDWLATKRLRFVAANGASRYLKFATHDELEETGLAAASPGFPERFTHEATEYLFAPSPNATYTANVVYYKKIPALSDAAPTNWLLTEAPDLYLYGALKHAQAYLMDDERWPGFVAQYEQILRDVQRTSHVDIVSGTPAPAPMMPTRRL